MSADNKAQPNQSPGFLRIGFVLAVLLCGAQLSSDRLALAQAQTDPVLVVEPRRGVVPKTVSILGPPALLRRIEAFLEQRRDCETHWPWGTHGFAIRWGDDKDESRVSPDPSPRDSDGCPDPLRHTYTTPGTYTITASLFHPGPPAVPVFEWEGATHVTLTGIDQDNRLRLLAPVGGELFTYGRSVPVEWEIATGQAVDLVLELVRTDGKVVQTRVIRQIAYDGQGRAFLPRGEASYEGLPKYGPGRARVRLRMVKDDQTIVSQLSEEFLLSAEWVQPADLLKGRPDRETRVVPAPGEPLTVELLHHTYHPDCTSYAIDWGDGSSVDEIVASIPKSCRFESAVVRNRHSYASAGTYRIVLRTNRNSPFKPLEDIVPYEIIVVVLE